MSKKIKKNRRKGKLGSIKEKRLASLAEAQKYEAIGDSYASQHNNAMALDNYLRALQFSSNSFEINRKIGNIYSRLKAYPRALSYFKKCQSIDGDNLEIKYIISCLSGGEIVPKAPLAWLESTFDGLATDFEQHLTELGYDIPKKLRKAFSQKVINDRKYKCLDLGCGTGLVGLEFGPFCDSLVGVDVSEGMILEAKKKKIYDQFYNSDIDDFFAGLTEKFDLFVATDVFIYIGEIQNIFKEIKRAALPDAFFLFSIERLEDSAGRGFRPLPTGRYAHSLPYITTLVAENEFEIVSQEETAIRKENDTDILGDIFILKVS